MTNSMKNKIEDMLDLEEESLDETEVNAEVEKELSELQNKKKKQKKKNEKTKKSEFKISKEETVVKEEPEVSSTSINEIRLFEPVEYKDTKEIADALIKGQVVYISLRYLSDNSANRIIDFLTGVVYGVAGDIARVNGELFICTPTDVEITDDLKQRV